MHPDLMILDYCVYTCIVKCTLYGVDFIDFSSSYCTYVCTSQVDVLQTESRKRLQSESDIKKSQEKMVEELHVREQKMLKQVRELKQDKQRLEDTIYRLKTEAMATNVSQQKLKEELEKERDALVRNPVVILRAMTVGVRLTVLLSVETY